MKQANDLIVGSPSCLRIWEDKNSLSEIKEIYGKELSDGEFKTFLNIGKATGLNPFLREIWAVKYGNSAANIFIGRDGYRKSAQSHPLYDYHIADAVYEKDQFIVSNGEIKHQYTLINRGKLIGAYCIVKRKNSTLPMYVFVELSEYSTGKSLWNPQTGKPATMIKKVAEAQGLRAAFQELFAGTYDESEQWEQNKKPPLKLVNAAEEVEKLDEMYEVHIFRLNMCSNLTDLQDEFKIAYRYWSAKKEQSDKLNKLIEIKDKKKNELENQILGPREEIDVVTGEIVEL